MVFPNVPGVQINEVRLGPPAIVGVGTSTAAFVGNAPGSGLTADTAPRLITSEDQFAALYMHNNDGSPAAQSTPLSRAVLGFFGNGGRACYVVNTGSNQVTDAVAGIDLFEPIDEIAILAAPGFTDDQVNIALRDQAQNTGDRFALFDSPARVNDIARLLPPAGPAGGEDRPPDTIWGAFYYPRIRVGPAIVDGTALTGDPALAAVTPVGHIAGVYARVDAAKGVHKAPANETVLGAIDLEHVLSDAQQEQLNPNGVNLLRVFGGQILVWGARTLQSAPPANTSFIYVSTRRLVNYISESLQDGLRYVVFEPNILSTRQQITRSARGFLDAVWRDGGLFGETPEQAYYVRFPAAFNTDAERAQGRLTVEIGLRVSFPAEFVRIRIGVLLQDASAA